MASLNVAEVDEWTAEMVAEWLTDLGCKQHAASFLEYGINGGDLLHLVDANTLEEMEITNADQLLILTGIDDLKKRKMQAKSKLTGMSSPRSRASGFREFDASEIKVGDKLSPGPRFLGSTFTATTRGMEVVAKRLRQRDTASFNAVKSEAEALALGDFHPCLVPLIGYNVTNGETYVVFDKVGGSFEDTFIKDTKPVPFASLVQIAIDVASALVFLHSRDILHRSIGARNVMIDSNLRAKLTDYSIGQTIYTASKDYLANPASEPVKWMAPECIESHKFSKASDVFAFGTFLWEIFGRSSPFANLSSENCVDKIIRENMRPMILPLDLCPANITSMMQKCWKPWPEDRPSMEQLYDDLEAIATEMKVSPASYSLYSDSSYATYHGYLDSVVAVVEEAKNAVDYESKISCSHKFVVTNYQDKKRAYRPKTFFTTDKWVAETKYNTQWHMRVYPNGGNDAYMDKVAVYVELSRKPPFPLKVGYTMRLMQPSRAEFTEIRTFSAESMAWGRHGFFAQVDVDSHDRLELELELDIFGQDQDSRNIEQLVMDPRSNFSSTRITVPKYQQLRKYYPRRKYYETAPWSSADGSKWHLRIYPNGGNDQYADDVAVYVELHEDVDQALLVKYTLKLIEPLSRTYSEGRVFSAESAAWGRHGFFAQGDYNHLVFEVDLMVVTEDTMVRQIAWSPAESRSRHRVTVGHYDGIREVFEFRAHYETPMWRAVDGSTWHLRVYPNGGNENYRREVAVYLERDSYDPETDTPLRVSYTLTLVGHPEISFTEKRTFSRENMAWGRHGLFRQSLVSAQSTLELEVEIVIEGVGRDEEV